MRFLRRFKYFSNVLNYNMAELKTLCDYLLVGGVKDRTFVNPQPGYGRYTIKSIFIENNTKILLIDVDYVNQPGGGSSRFFLHERFEDLELSVFEAENK